MIDSIEDHIRSCARCVRSKNPHLPHKAPLVPIVSSEPLEIVCMDYMSLETSKGGYSSILVITDHFTKFSVAVPTRNQTASTTAKALLEHLIYPYGIPRRLHSDQGANFESKIIKQLCEAHGIDKSRTTPYHPEGDGATERMNRTLLGMLRTLNENGKQDWKAHLNRLLHAYNTTTHTSTGYSPYFLMFGRKPKLPVDAFLQNTPKPDNYLEEMKARLQDAYRIAGENCDQARQHQKKNYDRKVRGGTPEVGDSVLVRRLGFTGKHKLEDKWEHDLYKVIQKEDPDIPVYKVQKENGQGKIRSLHRNHLQPLSSPLREEIISTPYSVCKKTKSDTILCSVSDIESESESDSDIQTRVEISIVEDVPSAVNLTEDVSFPIISDVNPVSLQVESEPHQISDIHFQTDSDSKALDEDNVLPPVEIHVPPVFEVRKSTRARKPPDRYGIAVSQQHSVHMDWQERASFLVYLVDIFPNKSNELYNAIIKIVVK